MPRYHPVQTIGKWHQAKDSNLLKRQIKLTNGQFKTQTMSDEEYKALQQHFTTTVFTGQTNIEYVDRIVEVPTDKKVIEYVEVNKSPNAIILTFMLLLGLGIGVGISK